LPTSVPERPAEKPAANPPAPPATTVAESGKTVTPTSAQKSATPGGDKGGQNGATWRRLSPFGEQVDRAVRGGVQFLKQQQRPDGSWLDVDNRFPTGTTSLVTLALLTAGEPTDSPKIRAALDYLRRFRPDDLRSTYAIALQTMVYAAAEPEPDKARIAANARWLEGAQVPLGNPESWPGSWTYSVPEEGQRGDNSNSRYALLGLHAAHKGGVPVDKQVVNLARAHWESCQKEDGTWGYSPNNPASSASMTCAGISSLIITGLNQSQGHEFLVGDQIQNCGKDGKDGFNPGVKHGLDWLAAHFEVGENLGHGQNNKYYYLSELAQTGWLSGMRLFGQCDWYRLGAEHLVNHQSKPAGVWRGAGAENELVATSFALLFLGEGSGLVLINKVRHGPLNDWNNDPVDVR
jgi:hypothetical protein